MLTTVHQIRKAGALPIMSHGERHQRPDCDVTFAAHGYICCSRAPSVSTGILIFAWGTGTMIHPDVRGAMEIAASGLREN